MRNFCIAFVSRKLFVLHFKGPLNNKLSQIQSFSLLKNNTMEMDHYRDIHVCIHYHVLKCC